MFLIDALLKIQQKYCWNVLYLLGWGKQPLAYPGSNPPPY